MESPYTIATLPKPLNVDGQVYAASVHSLRGSKKRKRHEVVVAVDGECLSIYNVQSHSLLASYALPPQTYLCCPPASVYIKSEGSPARRTTLCAIRESGRKARAICFTETLGGGGFAAPAKAEFTLHQTPISLADVFPNLPEQHAVPQILHGETSTAVDSSKLSISSSSEITIKDNTATLYDTTYGTVQASTALNAGEKSKKRKREQESPTPFQLVSYFSDIGLVAAVSGHALLAIQLTDEVRSKRARTKGTPLIDAIGKAPGRSSSSELKQKRANHWTEADQERLGSTDFLPVEDVVAALKSTIASLDVQPLSQADPALLEDDTKMADPTANSTYEHESLAAEAELDQAISALQTGLETRGYALRNIFARLRAFPSRTVKSALRSQLSHQHLVFLIQILRVELAEGGWTSRYIDVGNDEYANKIEAQERERGEEEAKGPSDQALRHIGVLLSCAVDAIGVSGWLVAQNGDEASEMLDSVRAEVSASLEGCLEAHNLQRCLAELEKVAAVQEKKATGGETSRQVARKRDAGVGSYSIDRIRF